MFRKMPTINNGDFKAVPSDLLIKIVDYLGYENTARIGQLNKFFNQLSKDQNLIKEQKVFILYSVMTKYYDHTNCDVSAYINGDIYQESIREHLDKQLNISKDAFLEEAKCMLSNKISLSEAAHYKKQFDDLILSTDISEEALDKMKELLHSFLYSLCFVGATNALNIFVKKYPNAIKSLSTEQFNSISVAAATNHLYNFMHYLCEQKKSIDEYTLVPNSIGGAIVTPFISACLRVFEKSFMLSPVRIAKAKQTIELLLANDADPTKQYIYDDLSDEALVEELNKGNGYSIIDICERNLSENKNNTHNQSTESDIQAHALTNFSKYLLLLKPKSAEIHRPNWAFG